MNGLLEWHGQVHSKGVRMKVDFTNGTVTAYGVAPATFMTKDALTQHIMENSDEFKSGRIFLVRSVPLPDTEKKEETVPETEAGTPLKKVEMPNVEDAKEYFADTYGINRSKLRTKAGIEEAAKGVGIEVVWTD